MSQTKYNKKVESIFRALFRKTLKNVVKTYKSGNTLQSGLEHDATWHFWKLKFKQKEWITVITLTCSLFMKFENRIQHEIINLVYIGNI